MKNNELLENREDIAIIGMAGRFPGARNIDEFWQNLRDGVESIKTFMPEELKASGFDLKLLKNPKYVNAGGVLDDADSFEASFFGISPKEAEFMDPQHRIFLECAWEAIENAGYDPEKYDGLIGVFGGVARNTYFIHNAALFRDLIGSGALYEVLIGSEKDFPATRVSYKLNLKGPSINVQTACSTSGVAIHLACQSLIGGECDIAIAGAARVQVPLKGGYIYVEGGITSPDGHCRAFDERARGTVYGSGVGIIVLKRLPDAIHDRDCIHAVIKGTAINNDGSDKVGFTAPSVKGQTTVIEEVLAVAEVDADSIDYVEAHGTGTALGDPIEIAALTKAFRKSTKKVDYCAIGSVKTNIGHLDAAACVAGIIKTVMALKNKLIPPSLNFERPNPQIDFINSPFYVNTKLQEWKADRAPRRAGVSSFGLGGTNAHIILEEAPEAESSGPSRPWQILQLSTKSKTALETATSNLAKQLKHNPHLNLADVAYTLQFGRKDFYHRRVVICKNCENAVTALETVDSKRVMTSFQEPITREIVFMFSGQASQYVNMGIELYRTESKFREQIDHCSEFLQPLLSLDLRDILYPDQKNAEDAAQMLKQTFVAQPALFITEYALAKLWMTWGVHPETLVGHSVGEYVAACLSGVFSLEDALSLVVDRGRLIQQLPGGSMLAVYLSEKEIRPYINEKISLAAINGPSLCVLSGEKEAVECLERQLSNKKVDCGYLHTSHAFHSKMMEPILDAFTEKVKRVKLNHPQIPFISNVTGRWISSDEAINPGYWAKHLRQTVRFADCAQELLKEPNRILLEVGPGQTLSVLMRQHPNMTEKHIVLSSTRHPKESRSDLEFILCTLGRLWLAGVDVNWSGFYAHEKRHRLPLPTYPFERKRYWIDKEEQTRADASQVLGSSIKLKEAPLPNRTNTDQKTEIAYDGSPRNDVEKVLINIWQELLGVKQVKIHDNFFDLGGNSLMAGRLNSQIEKTFGKILPPPTIFQAPTIEQLAKFLDQKGSIVPRYRSVVLRDGGSKPPLFCLPGALGNVFTDFGHLARHLGSDQPVYGLQDGVQNPSKVEALAAQYINEIRSVQPEGPYFLVGVCSGGTVAFEMAQQLLIQKQHIALLALVEPAPPNVTYWGMASFILDRFLNRFGQYSNHLSRLSSAEKKAYIRLRVKLITNMWALRRYVPQSYLGHIHIFLTSESLKFPRLGWRKLALGGAEVREIPGTHNTITGFNATRIVEAHMQALAEQLKVCIENALREKYMS